jgi:hypothetical protein
MYKWLKLGWYDKNECQTEKLPLAIGTKKSEFSPALFIFFTSFFPGLNNFLFHLLLSISGHSDSNNMYIFLSQLYFLKS